MRHKFVFSAATKARLEAYAKEAHFGLPAAFGGSTAPEAEVTAPLPAAESPVLLEEGPNGPAACTDVGKVRQGNEDSILFAPGIYGVADGMGGHLAGEVASGTARDELLAALRGIEPSPEALANAIRAVNDKLYTMQRRDPACAGMGTTLTVLWEAPDKLYIGHVGDSRAYRLRGGLLEQITLDHSVVAEMVRQGLITAEDAEVHPMRNVITRAVGTESVIEIDTLTEEKRAGDVWLLCSDGLHGMISHKTITQLLSGHEPAEAARLLLEAALEAGGRDNVSLVIYPVQEAAHA